MNRTTTVALAILAFGRAAFSLHADGIVSTYDATTKTIKMVDSYANNAVLIDSGGIPVYGTSPDFEGFGETPLDPEFIHFTAQPDGYDIEVTVINHDAVWRRMGTLWIADIMLGGTTHTRNFDYLKYSDREQTKISTTASDGSADATTYPGGSYSPVFVARGRVLVPPSGAPDVADAEYAIGISLQYPVVKYNTSILKQYRAFAGRWRMAFYPNPKNLGYGYDASADIPPYNSANPDASKRVYKYSVRVLRSPSGYPEYPAEWLRTLEPYREYFQKTYGAPRYAPDYRPIGGYIMAVKERCNQADPFGFAPLVSEDGPRPDKDGWSYTVADLQGQRDKGWPRQLLWAPSGCQPDPTSTDINYRYEFTSHWSVFPAMVSTQHLLTNYSYQNGGIGLWWGHSTNPMGGWGTFPPFPRMSQTNISHREQAFAELAGARAVGAHEIGLDAYDPNPRESFTWLEEMRLRYPEMRFCGEAVRSDIVHLLSANFMRMGEAPDTSVPAQGTDHSPCRPPIRPLALADFLLQRHETWAAALPPNINECDCDPRQGYWLDTNAMSYWPSYVATQGYVPLIQFSPNDRPENRTATDAIPTFGMTVPADLRTPYCPQVTRQPPVRVWGTCGLVADLTAAAISPRGQTLTYQWYFRPYSNDPAHDPLPADLIDAMMAPCTDPTRFSGWDTPTLHVVLGPQTFGTYRLLVTELDGGPTWSAYTRVRSLGDFNQDGVVDFFDYLDFVDVYSMHDPRADVNDDGVLDFFDYLDFVDAYSGNC